ncbi:hypothetical protein M2272_005028 [Mycobacterium frederiksbergense]|uniref:PE-PGRS family protein n=1 Tax=Mycolicibacterium frederiksbergense TaxID=117567 RepID=A0ABT6L615_9MYCO|nr:hypothetical protein [Mycolicibacterium frederiksbergense]MDH6198369.1 hypothetical protein [Mycolicibacterium frederiksbergense]
MDNLTLLTSNVRLVQVQATKGVVLQTAYRHRYITAGIALTGACAIALTPLAPPPASDMKLPLGQASNASVQLSALSQLATVPDPLTAWLDVFTAAGDNLGQIGGAMIANPAPLLQQFIKNQLGYGETVAQSLAVMAGGLAEKLTKQLPAALEKAAGQLMSGNISGAFLTVATEVLFTVATLGVPLMALAQPLQDMAQNAANVVGTMSYALVSLIASPVGTLLGTGQALADSGQAFVNAVAGGDPVKALNVLINVPARLTGAFLNGYASEFATPIPFPGILSPEGGIVPVLTVGLPQALAAAIGWTPPGSQLRSVKPQIEEGTAGSQALQDLGNVAALPGNETKLVDMQVGVVKSKALTDHVVVEGVSSETPASATETTTVDQTETGTEIDVKPANGGTDLSAGNKATSPSRITSPNRPDTRAKDLVSDTMKRIGGAPGGFRLGGGSKSRGSADHGTAAGDTGSGAKSGGASGAGSGGDE